MELLLRIIFAIGICYGTIALVCLVLKNTKTNILKRASDSCSPFLKTAITILLCVLFILNCIDAILTWYAITYIGAYEANGIMAWLIQQGWGWFFLFKVMMISLVVVELYFLYIIDYGKEGVFEDIESYAQYLTAHFGWTTPDARLYYADGRVAEISK
jgi:ABC-type multidrug transport system fused ATPase/permease subunit